MRRTSRGAARTCSCSSLATNRCGARWLSQHFPSHRVHAVTFDNVHPLHIDATWVPLRPGLVLHCGERPAEEDLLGYFKVNDWEVVHGSRSSRCRSGRWRPSEEA